jgi:Arc/MetJ family transcription regulator
MCTVFHHTHNGAPPRTNIEIDDALMAEAQKASGHATKKQTVEQALRLMIKLQRQRRSTRLSATPLARQTSPSRKGRGPRDRCRQVASGSTSSMAAMRPMSGTCALSSARTRSSSGI